jgi:hypothetical protein
VQQILVDAGHQRLSEQSTLKIVGDGLPVLLNGA